LRNHELNIERYQGLLKTKLSDIEQHYIEKRLSEERFSVAMLQFMHRISKQRCGIHPKCSDGDCGTGFRLVPASSKLKHKQGRHQRDRSCISFI
jgi:hypothetical protein